MSRDHDRIAQRDSDEAIMEERQPKWNGAGCYYCGSTDRMIHPVENEFEPFPCPVCNKEGER